MYLNLLLGNIIPLYLFTSTFSTVNWSIQHHRCSNIHLFTTYMTCFSRQLWPLKSNTTTILQLQFLETGCY